MASLADGLRDESRGLAGQPSFRRLQGWSFGLSYVDERCEFDWLAELDAHSIGHAIERARGPYWVPPGRGSTLSDWRFLGEMLAALRVARSAVERTGAKMEDGSTPPNATHYWIWHEADDGAASSKAVN